LLFFLLYYFLLWVKLVNPECKSGSPALLVKGIRLA
jgi:hypothetical protein